MPLGVLGGIDESNLSAYMVAPAGSNNYVCLDAGTLHAGIQKAVANKVFNVSAEQVLKQDIKGYCISHSHLDHLAGLLINAPDDTAKNIYALQPCIDVLKANYFTWKAWANFANEGEAPTLGKYHYSVLAPGAFVKIDHTDMQVQAFPLSHSNLISTAFLVRNGSNYLLYLGDTGADEVEKSQNFKHLWDAVAPLVKAHQLKALMIEVSFPDEQPDKFLFGHLTPHWLIKELDVLAAEAGATSMKNLNVVITHLKPPAKSITRIKQQLTAENKLGLRLIFPQQGKQLVF
ncbi:3',5'-cyclic-nucleotide phosphodiesterase [Mucilaginibacter yixingensis]|uniref:MBL fold metallo-hydrolase n=1 Tax=Mucilaginibacter yixingensis TaxID=1295612 RepID=UPI001FE769F4|nr:3',5'-cyclic-nucleotide phosphodiesterase [Mucilaginibacter yixingensis]